MAKKANMQISAGSSVLTEDLYRSGTLLVAMEQFKTAPSFIRDHMFPGEDIVESDSVVIDYYKAGNRLAPFVCHYAKGSTIPRQKMRSSTFKPPKVAPVLTLTADDLFNRALGSVDPIRESILLARDIEELDLRISRLEEWMAAECIQTGTVKIRNYDSQRIIAELDYGPVSTTVVNLPWTDPTSTPLGDLRTAMRGVASAANSIPTLIAFGGLAAEAFESHPQVQDAYSRLWIKQGEITPQMVSWGVTSLGSYRSVPLYIYESTYEGKNGNQLPYFDSKSVLVACTQTAGRFAYAGIGQTNDDQTNLQIFSGKRIPLLWFPDDSDMRKLRLASRPCPIPPAPENWTILKVLD
jgi:hypothetical protein